MTTLAELKTQVRARADMKDSLFVEDDELVYYINNSYAELYDIMTTAFQDYNIAAPYSFTLVGDGVASADLPTDFYKLRGVDYSLDGAQSFVSLYPFEFNRRNRKGNYTYQFNRTYRLVGNKIFITPEMQANGLYRLWYVPKPTKLLFDSDSINEFSGWDEYVIVDAAIKCKEKQEDDVTVMMTQKEALRVRIQAATRNRDAGAPSSISDISSQFADGNSPDMLGTWEY